MSQPCSVPTIEPRIALCPNGCVHLQVGPAIVLLSHAGLRALAAASAAAVATLAAPDTDDPTDVDPKRSVH